MSPLAVQPSAQGTCPTSQTCRPQGRPHSPCTRCTSSPTPACCSPGWPLCACSAWPTSTSCCAVLAVWGPWGAHPPAAHPPNTSAGECSSTAAGAEVCHCSVLALPSQECFSGVLLCLHGCGQHQQGRQEAAAAALCVLLMCSLCVSAHLHSCKAFFGFAAGVCISFCLVKLLTCSSVVGDMMLLDVIHVQHHYVQAAHRCQGGCRGPSRACHAHSVH